jgi:RNA polymerase sigma-B factor
VHKLARKFGSAPGTSREDLVQIGYVGLLGALERYCPEKGIAFSTFATHSILGTIKHHLRDHTWMIRVPRLQQEQGQDMVRIREALTAQLGRVPTIPELAAAAELTEERLLLLMELGRGYQCASLDDPAPGGPDAGGTLAEAVGAPDPDLAACELRLSLRRALTQLHPREQQLIQWRFFEEVSQAEVARRLSLSQMHISRMERQALVRLRALMG